MNTATALQKPNHRAPLRCCNSTKLQVNNMLHSIFEGTYEQDTLTRGALSPRTDQPSTVHNSLRST